MLVLFLVLLLASCSWPFGKKTSNAPANSEKGESVGQSDQPKPGDVKIVDGVEYIYARNRRYNEFDEPEQYKWVRKDEYSPTLFESLTGRLAGQSAADKQQNAELQQRVAKLETDLKQKNAAPQAAAPAQTTSLASTRFAATAPPIAFAYPSPKMRRRVLILPLADMTNYKEEHLDEMTTKKLISRLEKSGAIIAVDPHALDLPANLSTPEAMQSLNELYGIQAVVKGSLSDVYTSTSSVEGANPNDKQVSFALSKISLDIYNTETGKILRRLNGRNPFFLSRENGDMGSERAKINAIDLSIELIADDLLSSLLSLDWHTRIASVDADKVFLNAGRLSGLEKGDILEVYAPGTQVVDKTTSLALGRTKGAYKGEVEVVEDFGVDASWAKITKPASFAPTDLVYLKQP